jgi:alkylhydroperoxidase family enzyme
MLLNPKHSPRIRPLDPPYDRETAELLDALGGDLAVFRVLARTPERARGIRGWGSYYLSRRSQLSLRHRELVIDRTTALCGSEYEWGVHVALFADKVGLTPDQVTSTSAGGPDDSCWTDASDQAVLRAVDGLVRRHDLNDREWTDLVAAVGDEGAIDLLLLCGWYHAISFVTRVTRLGPETGAPIPSAATGGRQ